MTDSSTGTDWRRLREFGSVDLSQSFILSWHFESGQLLIDIDLFLTEEHPFFEKPRPAEKVCIRPAIIEFPYCESLSVEGEDDAPPGDVVRRLGHGLIDSLRRLDDGRYEISGPFGTVRIAAERPILKLKGP